MKIFIAVLVTLAVAAHADAKKRSRCFPVPTTDGPITILPPPTPEPSTETPLPPACGTNEEYSECGANGCQNTCENPTFSQVCRGICTPGCICKEGYLRDCNGNCVLESECTAVTPSPPECGPNQEYSECGANSCQMFCDWFLNPDSYACRPICTPGCICKAGYILDGNGVCITEAECSASTPPPQICSGKFESFTDCGTACPLTCDNVNNPPMFCTMQCVVGCFCDEGYVRNADGECVLPEQCPVIESKCPENEVYQTCGTACPLTCDNVNDPPMICTKQCVQGCFCEKGYVRNADGKCVLPEQCPVIEQKCSNKNEVYKTCGTLCPLTCKNYEFAPLYCSDVCVEGCFCEDGFVRNSAGECVLSETCPPNTCPNNEKWARCGGFCFEDNCRSLIPPVVMCAVAPEYCQPGCVCEHGTYRSKDGNCISESQCGKELCTEKNQELVSCTGPCDATCANPDLPQMCKAPCSPGCGCKKGFVRDENNECVALNSCPSQDKCGPFQEWRDCGPTNMCDSQICRGRQAPCSEEDAKICVAGCFCKEGYKNFGGDCVKKCPALP